MPIAEDVAAKLKDLLYQSWRKEAEEQLEKEAAAKSGAKGSSSSSNPSAKKSQDPHHEERLKQNFEKHWRIIKRIPGGYSSFDDSSSEPGCLWETEQLDMLYGPTHYPQVTIKVSSCLCLCYFRFGQLFELLVSSKSGRARQARHRPVLACMACTAHPAGVLRSWESSGHVVQ